MYTVPSRPTPTLRRAIADIGTIKQATPNSWDPQSNGWRFMPPLGLPLLNQRSAQLFHYPSMNLLNPSQDYPNDAVPPGWAELLQANGMQSMDDIVLYERLIDCAPIAAGDDAQAQGFNTVGDGSMIAASCPAAQTIMLQDIIAARWQMIMAANSTQNPQLVLAACTAYWNAPAQAAAICATVQHEGTLFYPTGTPAVFTFKTSLAQGGSFCQSNSNNPCAS